MNLVSPDDLDAMAERHEEAAKHLRKAAAVLRGSMNGHARKHDVPVLARRKRGGKQPTRLDQIRDYLREHGPSKRVEIVKGTGAPTGTVSYLLREDNGFVKKGSSRWDVEKSV